jgi:serine/threonine protein kinase
MVHRDVKPGNVLLDSQGKAKLGDFGLVKQLDGSRELCGTFVGTMLYLSPERLRGEQFGYSSDIWSMGILVYVLAPSIA